MSKPKTKNPQSELRPIEQLRIVSRTKILMQAIKWCSLLLIVWLAKGAIGGLAGKVTLANIRLDSNIFDSSWQWQLAVILIGVGGVVVGAAGLIYGFMQRSQKRAVIDSVGTRLSDLERLIDPKRSSSRLTRLGQTNPEDL